MDSYNIQNYIKRGKTVILTLRQGFDDAGSSATRQWTDKETTDLIMLMKEFLPEFKNQKRRKKEVWIDVTRKLQQSDSIWTPEDCRKKWSNMIRTFKTIEEQRREPSGSSKRIKWPFYDRMRELLECEGAESLPEASGVCAFMRDFPLETTEQGGILVTDLDLTETGMEGAGNVEEPVVADSMEFYLTDNQDGGVSGENPRGEFPLPDSGGDFQTLATVAAAVATEASAVDSVVGSVPPELGTLGGIKLEPTIPTIPISTLAGEGGVSKTENEQSGQVMVLPLGESLSQPVQPVPVQPLPQNSVPGTVSSSVRVPSSMGRLSDSNPPLRPPGGYLKRKAKMFRKDSRKRACTEEATESTGDPLVDKFIAISNKQSEKILERMEKYHEDTLNVMRERNKILENMVGFLKSQINTQPQTVVTSAPTVMTSQNIVSGPATIRVINAQTLARAGLLPSTSGLTTIAVKKQ